MTHQKRVGIFLTPDPFVQDPYDTQSWNRYAYVRNNPLNLTDPSGYFNLKQELRNAGRGLRKAAGAIAAFWLVGSDLISMYGCGFNNAFWTGAEQSAYAYVFNKLGEKYQESRAEAMMCRSLKTLTNAVGFGSGMAMASVGTPVLMVEAGITYTIAGWQAVELASDIFFDDPNIIPKKAEAPIAITNTALTASHPELLIEASVTKKD